MGRGEGRREQLYLECLIQSSSYVLQDNSGLRGCHGSTQLSGEKKRTVSFLPQWRALSPTLIPCLPPTPSKCLAPYIGEEEEARGAFITNLAGKGLGRPFSQDGKATHALGAGGII